MSSGTDGKTSVGGAKTAPSNPVSTRHKRAGYDLEDAFQIEAAAFFDLCLPVDAWWCHVPNGGKRAMKTARGLKAMGTKAGAPDNLIIYQCRAYWIELKARYGALAESQLIAIPLIESAGAPVAIARTLDDIAAALSGWGIPLRVSLDAFRNRRNYRTPATPTPQQRMSAAQFKAVMSLGGDAPKKAKASWQTTRTATRRRPATRAKSPA
jgi:hypothetical protein